MNIEKLKELREFMANLDESRVELNRFFSSEDSDHKKTYKQAREGNICGTTACIAGWASVLAPKEDIVLGEDPKKIVYDETAAKWLEISEYSPFQWTSLCHMFSPIHAIEETLGLSQREIALARIDWLIEHDGGAPDGHLGRGYYASLKQLKQEDEQ